MFDYNDMIKRAIQFFPTWSDIRKRYKKSNGGQLISSVIEEGIDIEKAIQEYIDFYFLDRYEGKESDVVAFAYVTNIGTIENLNLLSVIYDDLNLSVTENIELFLNNVTDMAYYENGKIYIREELYSTNKIIIKYDNETSEYELNKTHVWNIFDEFACFVSIQRHEWESNEDLIKRILYTSRNLPSATEDGLKSAIISELLNLEPTLDKDDIIIEGITAESLRRPYEGFSSLLDKLSDINRDVYKDKRWDLDLWQYDFKSIEYIDHKWNEVITKWQNGIGYDDDLNVVVSNAATQTDAVISLYDKSEEKLLTYVHNKDIPKNVKFKLKRYNNILNSSNVKYKISASDSIDITNKEIELSIYEEDIKKEKRYVQDLFKLGNNVIKVDRSKLTDTNNYQLEFMANENNYNMEISKCKVIYQNRYTKEIKEVKDLLKQAPGFILNAEGSLVNSSVKKTIKSVKNFTDSKNLVDSIDGGIEIYTKEGENSGQGSFSVSGLGMNFVHLETSYELAQLPKDCIRLNPYCYYDNGTITLRNDIPQDKVVEFFVKGNIFTFEILDECSIDMYITDPKTNKKTYKQLKGPMVYTSSETDSPVNHSIKLISNESIPVKISNIKYASFNFLLKLKNGSILTTNDGKLMLPNFNENALSIVMTTYYGYSPKIKSIYIGGDFSKIKYKTEVIPYVTDCDRIFEVNSNCLINLLQTDSYGTVQKITNNYEPVTTYKGTGDNSWIRLNLEEYNSVTSIEASNGSVEVIAESGVEYYNIRLKNGEMISSIVVNGIRNRAARTVSLIDIILKYIPNFDRTVDKIYCSKLSEGLIIAKSSKDESYISILQIRSKIFTGINASKYKFTKIPDDIGVIFGSESMVNQSYEHTGSFDYISFFPANSDVYTAINEYDLFLNEVRNIKIVNNFNPVLNSSLIYFYKIEPFDKESKLQTKFCNTLDEDKDFSLLNDWSLGEKKIALYLNIDLSNSINYDISEYDIEEDIILSKYINIKPSYTLTNNDIVTTNKFIVIPPEGLTVEYKTYDGKDELSELIKSEEIIIESDGFNKLEYSNIDSILYIGTEPYSGKNEILFKDYELLENEGILIWTDKELLQKNPKIFVRYCIKNPIALVYDIDALYKAIDYTVDAYNEIQRFILEDMQDGQRYDLRNISNFSEADLVHVSCSEPSFEAQLTDNILKFRKYAEENTLLVKTGYYYINGKEYYLFSNKDNLGIDKNNNFESHNIEISGGEITFVKATNNYVRNSEMKLKGMNELYKFDCTKPLVYGISNFNNLTACESFNEWNTFGTKIYFKQGLNGLGLSFSSQIENGYAFIDITDYLSDINYISFWADESLSVYIGKEEKYMDLKFPRAISIELEYEIRYTNTEIRVGKILKEDNKHRYYLVVKGNGTIDDIIINTEELESSLLHKKNIDKLGLIIDEQKSAGVHYRINIPNNRYCISEGASITSDGYIRTTSNIDWGLTTFKVYDDRDTFTTCALNNIAVENDYIYTIDKEGYLETEPLFIDNPLTIKRMFFKINNINFDNMKGIKTTFYTSNNKKGPFIPCIYFNDNYGFVYGDYLSKYIKVRLDIPKNKILDNFVLFMEYKSDNQNQPKLYNPSNGYLISKVYDIQESLNYKIKSINIDSISNINDVEISIRAAKDKYSADVWLPWKTVKINKDYKLVNIIEFEDSRFFQVKIDLKTKDAYIKFNYLELEVI